MNKKEWCVCVSVNKMESCTGHHNNNYDPCFCYFSSPVCFPSTALLIFRLFWKFGLNTSVTNWRKAKVNRFPCFNPFSLKPLYHARLSSCIKPISMSRGTSLDRPYVLKTMFTIETWRTSWLNWIIQTFTELQKRENVQCTCRADTDIWATKKTRIQTWANFSPFLS